MNCPVCKSDEEMVFSPMGSCFICQEESCGLEQEVSGAELEELLYPEDVLVAM